MVRSFKDMITAHTNSHHDDWDEHLAVVAGAYRSTVNDATGFTPNFLLYGREVGQPSEEHIAELKEDQNIHAYARDLRDAMEFFWTNAAKQVSDNSDNLNRMPLRRLQFKPFEVGDYFYHTRVPRRFHRDAEEDKIYKLSSKLQFRYTGPYRVVKVLSPVTYQADMNGKVITVHAISMKRR